MTLYADDEITEMEDGYAFALLADHTCVAASSRSPGTTFTVEKPTDGRMTVGHQGRHGESTCVRLTALGPAADGGLRYKVSFNDLDAPGRTWSFCRLPQLVQQAEVIASELVSRLNVPQGAQAK